MLAYHHRRVYTALVVLQQIAEKRNTDAITAVRAFVAKLDCMNWPLHIREQQRQTSEEALAQIVKRGDAGAIAESGGHI